MSNGIVIIGSGFAARQLVKNIRKDTRFELPFKPFSRRITRAVSYVWGCACLPARLPQRER